MRYHPLTPYIFVGPMIAGLVIFRFGPILASLAISFTEWRGTVAPRFIGLENYQELMESEIFWEVMVNTLQFAAGFVPATMLLGFTLAVLVNQQIKGVAFFRGMYYLPAITSMIAVALVWNWIFQGRFGVVNYILRSWFGFTSPPNWLADRNTSLWVLVIVSAWKSAGFSMMIFLAGLKSVPNQLYEAARIDGADSWQQLLFITLPMITPVTFFVLILTIFEAFGTFEVTIAMTGGGPLNSSTTLPYYVYQNAFQFFRYGFASSAAYVLTIIVIIITVINFIFRRRWVQSDLY
ncbi:MAG: sugar ABC transporter permease [Chloroflexota bacterium]